MSRKIIGITVGTQLPKPNFKQTDPTKGDFIRNKPDFDGLKKKVNTISDLVGETSVEEQINSALLNQVGQKTDDGGEIFNDYENNKATAKYASAFGSNNTAAGEASLAGGAKAFASGEYRLNEEGIEIIPDEAVRYNESIGSGSIALGNGAVAYSKASNSLGYRTQTGYPSSAKDIAKRTHHVDSEGFIVEAGADTTEIIEVTTKIINDYIYNYPIIASEGFINSDGTNKAFVRAGDGELIIDVSLMSVSDIKFDYSIAAESKYDCTVSLIDATGENIKSKSFYDLVDSGSIIASFEENNTTAFIKISIKRTTTSGKITLKFNSSVDSYLRGYPAENTGMAAVAIGSDTKALANNSLAGGYMSVASGNASVAIGREVEATRTGAVGFGYYTKTKNRYGLTAGVGVETTTSSEDGQVAFGSYNKPINNALLVIGNGTDNENRSNAFVVNKLGNVQAGPNSEASGAYSVAMGYNAKATNDRTVALGLNTTAEGKYSFAGNMGTKASGYASTALGRETVATKMAQTIIGKYNAYENGEIDNALFAVGNGAGVDNRSNAFIVNTDGSVKASGNVYANNKVLATEEYVDANKGFNPFSTDTNITIGGTASMDGDNIAIGYGATAGNYYGVAIGGDAQAKADNAIAIGQLTQADGANSVAIGYNTVSEGASSISIGESSKAKGSYSVALGLCSKAIGDESFAFGDSSVASGYASVTIGLESTASGKHAAALGYMTLASGDDSFAVGGLYSENDTDTRTVASGNGAVAMGSGVAASNTYSMAVGKKTIASGSGSFAQGINSVAEGLSSIAMGSNATATGSYSLSVGSNTQATAERAVALGNGAIASGKHSFASNISTVASAHSSVAMGRGTKATATSQMAVGSFNAEDATARFIVGGGTSDTDRKNALTVSAAGVVKASGDVYANEKILATKEYVNSKDALLATKEYVKEYVDENSFSPFSGCDILIGGESLELDNDACAIGYGSKANGCSVALGYMSEARGFNSIAIVEDSKAIGDKSIAIGNGTLSDYSKQISLGCYNESKASCIFSIGNGTYDSRQNTFEIGFNGNVRTNGEYGSMGADYAEMFEWQDGNPEAEDRIGYVVTLDGDKIRKAQLGDEILGIISGTAAVLGDSAAMNWKDKYVTDEFGRIQYELVEEFREVKDRETGEMTKESIGFFNHPVINPNFNPDEEYIPREQRPEWGKVGLMGKLYTRDDGTCVVGGYATVGTNGVLTNSETPTNIKVMKRTSNNIVLALLK